MTDAKTTISGSPRDPVSELRTLEAPPWKSLGDYHDIRFEVADGIAKITINRPEVRNAFRPQTLFELTDAFSAARDDPDVGVIILTGEGPDAFCSGGDQRIRGDDGYIGDDSVAQRGIGRLNVLDLQVLIRRIPKPVVAMVAGYAIGGGHVLHLVCDLTIAADNARFGQTGPMVGSFDGGYGAGLLARTIGLKRAKEVWFLCRQYDAAGALDWGLVNAVVPLDELEAETVAWCRRMLELSPIALRMIKAGLNAADEGLAGIQQLAGDATMLFYMTEEGQEGRNAYNERRKPDFSRFPAPPVTDAAAGPSAGAGPSIGNVRKWILGARPRTLVAAAVPVAVGTVLARWLDQSLLVAYGRLNALGRPRASFPINGLIWWRVFAALVVALFVQIGTNYANDYSDGKRGTDDVRVGPLRLVASRLASPHAVRNAAFACFGVAAVAGLALAAATSWWLLVVGAACFAAGWFYTGGPKPYGYIGLGEVFVFAFFGVVATMGTVYVLVGRVTLVSFVASIPVGFLAVALLEANNLRDVDGDTRSGKKTLAVRLGRTRATHLYTGSLVAVAVGVGLLSHWRPYVLISLVAIPLAFVPVRLVTSGAQGRDLLPALIATARLQLVVGVLVTVGILL